MDIEEICERIAVGVLNIIIAAVLCVMLFIVFAVALTFWWVAPSIIGLCIAGYLVGNSWFDI